jgi:hypothetical protein
MNLFPHKVLYRAALLAACVLTVLGLAVAHTGVAHAARLPPGRGSYLADRFAGYVRIYLLADSYRARMNVPFSCQ